MNITILAMEMHMLAMSRLAEFHDQITAWRNYLHQHPDMPFDQRHSAGVVDRYSKCLLSPSGCY